MKIEPNLGLVKQQFNNQTSNNLENKFKDLLKQKEEAMAQQGTSETEKDLDDKQVESQEGSGEVDEEILAVSQEFESIFVGMMFKQMRDAINRSDLLDGGLSQDIYEDMYYDELAKEAAKTRQFDIAEAVYKQLSGRELE